MAEEETPMTRDELIAFRVEAVRSGLFASALDITETMKEAGVEDVGGIIVTAAIEFAVQLWEQSMMAAGHTPKASREALESEVRFYIKKYRNLPLPEGSAVLAKPS